jgi:peptidoglycan hydrolase FlgJ
MNTTLPTLAIPATPVDTTAASTYTDLNGLAALKRDPTSPQAIEGVAAQVEALFLQMMLKSMRDATASDDPDSNEMGMYQDMFDKQVALSISQHDDLGIGAMLKRQLSGKTAPAAPKQAAASVQTPAQFIDHVMPSIRRAAAALGVNPKGLLAQAALETGWGQRMPRNADGSSSLNLFGVKAGDEWAGARATADTVEFNNGVATPRRSVFRSYGSIEESVSDFANLLKNSPRYRQAIAAGADPQHYIDGIGRSGYATDPDYADKLSQILNSGALQAALIPRTAAL